MNTRHALLFFVLYADAAFASDSRSIYSHIQQLSDFYFYALCAALLLFFLGLVSVAGTAWFYRAASIKCRLYRDKLHDEKANFSRQEFFLSSHNLLLEKKLRIRANYIKEISRNVKRMIGKKTISASEASEIRTYISDTMDVLTNEKSDSGVPSDGVSCVCMYSLISAVVSAWEKECNEENIIIRFKATANRACIPSAKLMLDDIFNCILANILSSAYKGQSFLITAEPHMGSLVVTITEDCSDRKHNGKEQGIPEQQQTAFSIHDFSGYTEELIKESGGSLMTYSRDKQYVTSISWPEFSVKQSALDMLKADCDNPECEDQIVSPETDPWLRDTFQLIEEKFADPDFSMSAAAACLYMSERSLQRKFKKLAGKTFTEYLIEVRLEHARLCLLKGEKVSEAALVSGFSDPSYFSRRFRLRYGMPPSQVNTPQ